MNIVRFAAEHLEAVAALEATVGDVRWSRGQLEKELALPVSRFFVALDGSTVCAYGGYWKVETEAQITNFLVAPGYRCKGIGTQLLNALMEHARQETCTFMTLDVRQSNAHGQALYRKVGFTENGRRPKFYSHPEEDAVLMDKRL